MWWWLPDENKYDYLLSVNLFSSVFFIDDLDIKAVHDCIVMGFSEEQIGDALSILKLRRPGLLLYNSPLYYSETWLNQTPLEPLHCLCLK